MAGWRAGRWKQIRNDEEKYCQMPVIFCYSFNFQTKHTHVSYIWFIYPLLGMCVDCHVPSFASNPACARTKSQTENRQIQMDFFENKEISAAEQFAFTRMTSPENQNVSAAQVVAGSRLHFAAQALMNPKPNANMYWMMCIHIARTTFFFVCLEM